MSGWATPAQAASVPSDFGRETGELKTGSLRRRCERVADELVTFAAALPAAKAEGGALGLTAPRPDASIAGGASYHRGTRDVAVYRSLNLGLARRAPGRRRRARTDATEPRRAVTNGLQEGSSETCSPPRPRMITDRHRRLLIDGANFIYGVS